MSPLFCFLPKGEFEVKRIAFFVYSLFIVGTIAVGFNSIFISRDAQAHTSGESVHVDNLRINQLTCPYGINEKDDPVFSWEITDPSSNNVYQKSYRIVISTTRKQVQKGIGNVIDSSWVLSAKQTDVKLKNIGNELTNNSLYYWSVQIKNNKGQVSNISKPEAFTTKTSWQSTNAIWVKASGSQKKDFVFARKQFVIKDIHDIRKAVVSVAAKSNDKTRQFVYSFYTNGHFIGEGPVRNNGDDYYYNDFDITKYLKTGKNVLGALNYSIDKPGFLCQLTVYYKNGHKKILTSSGIRNSGWQVKDGTSAFGDNGKSLGTVYYFVSAQNINELAFPNNWDKPGYKATYQAGWTTPISMGNYLDTSKNKLLAYPSENVKRYKVKPISVTNKGKGHYIIDLGKEIIGGLSLKKIVSNKISKVRILYGEEMVPKAAHVKWRMLTGNNYEEYWTFKKGFQSIESTDLIAYRYIEIYNCPVKLTINNVRGLALHQAFNKKQSSFTSSNHLLNKIYKLTKYSIEATNQDLMVDSQSRERGVYEGDTLINSLSSYSFENNYSLSQLSIDYAIDHPTWPAEYGLYSVINAWNNYLYTGDKSLLKEKYHKLKISRNDLFTKDISSNGLIRNSNQIPGTTNSVLVDWPAYERDGYVFGKYNTVLNSVAYGAYMDMAKIAKILDKNNDEKTYKNYAKHLKEGMFKILYDKKTGTFRDSENTDHASEHAQIFPLAFNVVTNQTMANRLISNIAKNGTNIKTSIYGAYFLLSGLYNEDAGSIAMKLLTSTGLSSWYHVLTNLKSTITPEAWDPMLKPNMTFSHPWGTAPASQIVRGMFGIQTIKAAFNTFQIKLQPGNIQRASIKVPTVKGSIKVFFQYNVFYRTMSAQVFIPVNSKAVVYLPTKIDNNEFNEFLIINGHKHKVQRQGNFLKTILGSGEYSLSN